MKHLSLLRQQQRRRLAKVWNERPKQLVMKPRRRKKEKRRSRRTRSHLIKNQNTSNRAQIFRCLSIYIKMHCLVLAFPVLFEKRASVVCICKVEHSANSPPLFDVLFIFFSVSRKRRTNHVHSTNLDHFHSWKSVIASCRTQRTVRTMSASVPQTPANVSRVYRDLIVTSPPQCF